jgi:glutaminyl-tRNA synthetase
MIEKTTDSVNFIQKIIDEDNESGKWDNRVHTRFPPEPNGYLHIGHAKSICLNFGIADKNDGKCNLRFDDTNPTREENEYVESIIEDVNWLGFDWEDRLFYASDYFDQLFEFAMQLIKSGKAYVCDLTGEEIRTTRGNLKAPGTESHFRNRFIEENIELFNQMKSGNFENGEKVLLAKIDMSHPNLNMRDPVMYRILHASHHRTGEEWCIYPMYDWAHGLDDSLEKITHSICTVEFEDHRPLYDWYLDQLDVFHPQQIEFARLNLNFTIMSKRKLKKLVDENHVDGWDDPRMPTISGLKRRGYSPESIRNFAEDVGVTKRDSIIDVVRLENALREDLNKRAPRVLGVLNPLKVVITNYPEIHTEMMEAVNNPEDPSTGKREIPFSKELYIEQNDFMEDPPRKFFRLGPGREVRLRYAYYITCTDTIKNDKGEVVELRCTYDPETRGGSSPDGRKVKGTIHWVSANHAVDAHVRLYDRLFLKENPDDGDNFLQYINPNSCTLLENVKLEPSLAIPENITYQFERNGYFVKDEKDSSENQLIFNRAVSLRDSWAKFLKQSGH